MESERWSTERLAVVVAMKDASSGTDPVSVVLEDNGFEGSREAVLRAASERGKAASIFWNINGMVVFSCARRGKLLWSGELGMGEDLDGLPRSLVPFAELVETDEERDPVAVGAAMAATFTGVEVRPELIAGVEWYTVSPHVAQPEPITAESSGLRWDHSELLSALVAVAPGNRRALVHEIAHAAVRQASLADDEVVAPVLNSVRVDAPGAISAGFESWEKRWARENDELWHLQDEAINNGGVEPLPEEEQRVYRPNWVANALRYACHDDDLTALLGVSNAAIQLFTMDGHQDVAVQALTSAAKAGREGQVSKLGGLPSPPTPEDRDATLEQQRRGRQRAEQEAEVAEEAEYWGGRPPTPRMRASGGARALAQRDRDLLDLLDPLPDDVLTAITDWAARRVLSDAGLWELPWVQDATRGGSQLDHLFELLFSDSRVPHTSFVNDEGIRCSRQAMALPAVAAYSLTDPFDAACTALSPAGDGPRHEAASIYRETRERFELD